MLLDSASTMSALADITNAPSRSKKRKLSGLTKGGSGSEHVKIAERFMQFCDALDSVLTCYVRCVPKHQPQADYPAAVPGEPYLITHLQHCISSWTAGHQVTRSGTSHAIMKMQGKDGRRNVPKGLHQLLKDKYIHEKVEAKWIACYLAGIRPDLLVDGWEYHECSHRCITYGLGQHGLTCIDAACLTWESKAMNQSRGHSFCMRICKHDGCSKTLCECQEIHDPSCK